MQGACVCHVVSTASPVGAVTARNAGEWLDYFENSRGNPDVRAPDTYLLSLPELIKAVRKPHSAGDRSNAAGVPISDQEYDWLRRFHENVRNQLVHFEPQGWSIEISGIPELGTLIGRVIGDILEVGWAFRHKERDWQNALRENVELLSAADWLLK